MLYVISSVTLKLTNESNMHSKNLQKVTLKSSRPYNSFGWKFGFFSGKKYLMLLLSLRQLEEKSLWKISNCWKYFMLWRGVFFLQKMVQLGIKNMEQNVKCVCHSDLSYQNCQTQKIERNEKYCSQFPLFVCVLSDSLSLLHWEFEILKISWCN